jgi:hypothetical protein
MLEKQGSHHIGQAWLDLIRTGWLFLDPHYQFLFALCTRGDLIAPSTKAFWGQSQFLWAWPDPASARAPPVLSTLYPAPPQPIFYALPILE